MPAHQIENLDARFWSKVNLLGPGGCWIWTAAVGSHGYGAFGQGSRLFLAHRLSYQELMGPIPKDLTIDHLCRTRRCVNPHHLEVVSRSENGRRAAKWRH